MKSVRLDRLARKQIREILKFSEKRWGEARAEAYVRELSATFDAIAAGAARSRQIPAFLGVTGFVCPCQRHFIYWRPIGDDTVAIVAVLHQSMHQDRMLLAAIFEMP